MGEYCSIATEKISLATAVTFNQLDWWGAYAWGGTPSVLDNFPMYVYSDAGVIPGALITRRSMSPFNVSFTGHQISFGGPSTLSNEYAYSAIVPNVTPGPGMSYLGLERFAGFLTYTDPGYTQWVWATSGGGAQSTGQTAGLYADPATPAHWVPLAATGQAFDAIYNAPAVPEPGTWVMFAAGLGLTLGARRRRRAPGVSAERTGGATVC